ncbi:hypothetical protein [Kitasatospora sp. NPDC001683]
MGRAAGRITAADPGQPSDTSRLRIDDRDGQRHICRGDEEQLFPALRARARPDALRRCERRLREARAGPRGSRCPTVWGLPPGAGAITALRNHLAGHDTTGQRSP